MDRKTQRAIRVLRYFCTRGVGCGPTGYIHRITIGGRTGLAASDGRALGFIPLDCPEELTRIPGHPRTPQWGPDPRANCTGWIDPQTQERHMPITDASQWETFNKFNAQRLFAGALDGGDGSHVPELAGVTLRQLLGASMAEQQMHDPVIGPPGRTTPSLWFCVRIRLSAGEACFGGWYLRLALWLLAGDPVRVELPSEFHPIKIFGACGSAVCIAPVRVL